MSSGASSLWQDARRWLPGVLISLLAVFAIFRLVRWQDVGQAFRLIRVDYLLIAVALTFVFLAARALAWQSLLEDKATFRQTFFTINAGYLLNNLFPLRAGELGRAVLMGQQSGLGMMHVLSTIVLERAFDLAVAAGLLLSTLPLALGMDWARPIALMTLALVLAGLVALYGMARYNEKVHDWVMRLGKRSAWVERWIVPQIDNLLRGLRVLVQPARFLRSVFWILVSWLTAVVLYYVMVLSIAPQAPWWWGAFLDSMLAVGIAIPAAPAALGTFEGSLIGALALLNVPYAPAFAYAVSIHSMQVLITGILGFVGLAREGRSVTALFAELRLRQTTK